MHPCLIMHHQRAIIHAKQMCPISMHFKESIAHTVIWLIIHEPLMSSFLKWLIPE